MKSQSHLSILAKIFLTVVAVTIGGVLQAAPETKKDAAASQPDRKGIQHAEGGGGFSDSGRGIIRRRSAKGNPGTR